MLARLDAQRELVPGLAVRPEVTHHQEVPVVLGDESRLRQVLSKLTTNALTHNPPVPGR